MGRILGSCSLYRQQAAKERVSLIPSTSNTLDRFTIYYHKYYKHRHMLDAEFMTNHAQGRLLQSDWLWQDSSTANRNLFRVLRPFLLSPLLFRPRPLTNPRAHKRVWLRETNRSIHPLPPLLSPALHHYMQHIIRMWLTACSHAYWKR